MELAQTEKKMFEVTGKIEVIYDTQQVSEKFKKREFVIEIQAGMYPEFPKFQVTQERCGLLDTFEEGDLIKVSFNLRGRPYEKAGEKTYFTNLEAWRIDLSVGATAPVSPPIAPIAPPPTAPQPKRPTPPPPKDVPQQIAGTEDDLPF